MYFILGISLMLNLVFIIGFFKFYKKIFGNSKQELLNNMQKELDLAFFNLNNKNLKKSINYDNKDNKDLDSIFKTNADLDDFWK